MMSFKLKREVTFAILEAVRGGSPVHVGPQGRGSWEGEPAPHHFASKGSNLLVGHRVVVVQGLAVSKGLVAARVGAGVGLLPRVAAHVAPHTVGVAEG